MLTLGIIGYIILGLAFTFGALVLTAKNEGYVKGEQVWLSFLLFGVMWPVVVPMMVIVFIIVELGDQIAYKINRFANNH